MVQLEPHRGHVVSAVHPRRHRGHLLVAGRRSPASSPARPPSTSPTARSTSCEPLTDVGGRGHRAGGRRRGGGASSSPSTGPSTGRRAASSWPGSCYTPPSTCRPTSTPPTPSGASRGRQPSAADRGAAPARHRRGDRADRRAVHRRGPRCGPPGSSTSGDGARRATERGVAGRSGSLRPKPASGRRSDSRGQLLGALLEAVGQMVEHVVEESSSPSASAPASTFRRRGPRSAGRRPHRHDGEQLLLLGEEVALLQDGLDLVFARVVDGLDERCRKPW